jgi:hypothetical protein
MCLWFPHVSLNTLTAFSKSKTDTKNSGEVLYNCGTVQHTRAQNTYTYQVQLRPETVAKTDGAVLLSLNCLRYYFAEHKTSLTYAASIEQTSSPEQSVNVVGLVNMSVRAGCRFSPCLLYLKL